MGRKELKKHIVPTKQQNFLKKKGFDEPCYRYYDNKGDICGKFINPDIPFNYSSVEYYLCPSQSMACAWLREVHKVLIVIDAYHADHWEGYIDSFEISIYSHASTIIVPNEIAHHTDYEDAVESAIKYCLENLI